MKSLVKLLLVAVAMIALPSLALAAAELRDPDPIAVPTKLSAEQVATEIKRALAGRGWTVSKESAGRIDSTLYLRSHVARIEVTFDAQQVTLRYVSSENLDYEEKKGKRLIHRNYMSWIGNLSGDISRNLQTAAL